MLVFLTITILFLTAISADIKIGVKFEFDVLLNHGIAKVRLWGIPVLKLGLSFEHDDFARNNIVIKLGKKIFRIRITSDEAEKKSTKSMLKSPLIKCVRVKKLWVTLTAGKSDDPFFTTMILSAARIAICSFLSAVKCRYGADVYECVVPSYTKDTVEGEISGIIAFSIADITCETFSAALSKAALIRRRKLYDTIR